MENLLWWSFFTFIYIRSTNMYYFIYSSHHCLYLLHISTGQVYYLLMEATEKWKLCTGPLGNWISIFFLPLLNVYVSSSQSE